MQSWAAKLRIYETYSTGSLSPYGTGKPGNYGDPTIGITGWPSVGSPIDVWLDDTQPAAPCFLLLGRPGTIAVPPLRSRGDDWRERTW